MARYLGPEHTSGIDFSTGRSARIDDKGGFELPDDLTESELADLARNGFTLEPAASEGKAEKTEIVTEPKTAVTTPAASEGKAAK